VGRSASEASGLGHVIDERTQKVSHLSKKEQISQEQYPNPRGMQRHPVKNGFKSLMWRVIIGKNRDRSLNLPEEMNGFAFCVKEIHRGKANFKSNKDCT
jgi:hypothetical protein